VGKLLLLTGKADMQKQTPDTSPDEIVGRNLKYPRYIWDALDNDAERCGRSGIKQLEALLLAHYNLRDVELSGEGLERMAEVSKPAMRKRA
jgi:hypothetical protein